MLVGERSGRVELWVVNLLEGVSRVGATYAAFPPELGRAAWCSPLRTAA